jgi:hypothetical protein
MQMRRLDVKRYDLSITNTINDVFKDVSGYPLKVHFYKITHNFHNYQTHFVIEVQQSVFKRGYPKDSNKLIE